jgi:lysophospholipase L1-like esterase
VTGRFVVPAGCATPVQNRLSGVERRRTVCDMLRKFRLTRRSMTRTGVVLVAAIGLVVGAVAVPANAAERQASVDTVRPTHSYSVPANGYVALGDSFTSGQGAPPYDHGACLHSRYGSFPTFAALLSRYRLTANLACSGADIAAVGAQVALVPANTAVITVTVGGIDAGSDRVLAACAPDPTSAACISAVVTAQAALPTLAPKLVALYHAIAAKAPHARVIVLGYPRLFNPGVDAPLGDAVNVASDALDAVIHGAVVAAADQRVSYVDVNPQFANHGIGARVPYINLTTSTLLAQANFHPNYLGNLLAYPAALRPYGL